MCTCVRMCVCVSVCVCACAWQMLCEYARRATDWQPMGGAFRMLKSFGFALVTSPVIIVNCKLLSREL